MRQRSLVRVAIFGAILAASLVLNVVLLLEGRDRDDPPTGLAEGARTGAPDALAAEADLCRSRLKACRREGMERVMRVFAPPPAPAAPGEHGAAPATGPGAPPRVVDLELQQSVLCDLAKRKVRQRWKGKREKIAANLLEELKDPAKQRKDAEEEVAQFAATLGLSEGQKGELMRRYGAERAQRIRMARAALERKSGRYQALLKEVRLLFAGEDRLVKDIAGAAAREQLRAAQLEERTLILAILAAMADQPWEQAVSW